MAAVERLGLLRDQVGVTKVTVTVVTGAGGAGWGVGRRGGGRGSQCPSPQAARTRSMAVDKRVASRRCIRAAFRELPECAKITRNSSVLSSRPRRHPVVRCRVVFTFIARVVVLAMI